MKTKIYITLFLGFVFSFDKIDINNANKEDIMSFPLSSEKNNAIWDFINHSGNISNIYDLLYVNNLDINDIHLLKAYIKITHKKYNFDIDNMFKTHNWLTADGNEQGLSESYLHYYYNPININYMNYEDLYAFQNLTPMDVVSVLKRLNSGEISESFQLKNCGISKYGLKNLTPFISYGDSKDKIYLRYSALAKSFPSSSGVEEESIPIEFIDNSSPETLIKMMVGHKDEYRNISIGTVRSDNLGQSSSIYSDKLFIEFDKVKNKKNKSSYGLSLDKIIIGNFKASFGQGLVFESTDYGGRNATGYNFSKRRTGISYDLTKSHQYTLDGIALQLISEKMRISYFLSNGLLTNSNMRDAVINNDGSFSTLISMNQRLEYGYSQDMEIFHESLVNSVEEWTMGANIRFSPIVSTNIGFTFYESLYNRELKPDFINTIIGGEDNEGDNDYLNYMGNSADSEINAMYASSGTSDLWSSAQSFRRVLGFDLNTVIENVSFQVEYGQMDTNDKYFDDEPDAIIANTYMVFDNFDLLILYRNYDLEYDNPYQRSYSRYQRFKSTILEDDYNLNDLVFYNIYQGNPQPQAEKGLFVSSRYVFHRALTGTIEWDSWVRQADKAQYYRIVGKLEWKPVFKYRINFRYKWQQRASFDIAHPSPYYIKEARITFKLNLSDYNKMELLYAWGYAQFSPRPRLISSPNPFVTQMSVGDTGSPDVSIGASFEHRFDDHIKIKAGMVYVGRYLWYIEDNDFKSFNTNDGLIHNWISFNYRANNFFTFKMKLSHTSDFASNTTTGVQIQNGNYLTNAYTFDENLNYKIQLDYVF